MLELVIAQFNAKVLLGVKPKILPAATEMTPPEVNTTAISNAVETKLWEQLKQYSEETGIPMSKLLDKSIDLFLKTVNK